MGDHYLETSKTNGEEAGVDLSLCLRWFVGTAERRAMLKGIVLQEIRNGK